MKIEERKEVTRTTVESVLVGRKCDFCGKDVNPRNYFVIATHHSDWGNDSVDSWEYKDACCPECVMPFTQTYVADAYKNDCNTHVIEIRHVRCG